MNYQFENLNDERFQELCQVLLLKEFHNIQCFPVGQADGGRDAVSYLEGNTSKSFIVFQVKYSTNFEKSNLFSWIREAMANEIQKINSLKSRGATRYFFLTNVRGTGVLDRGTIDLIDKYMRENIPVPCTCWWRDDISRRFDADPLLKWSFPEIINGQDILNSVLFSHLKEREVERESVIRAYLSDQYSIDNEVKFKQINLQNRLLELYTDVPLKIKKFNSRNHKYRDFLEHTFGGIKFQRLGEEDFMDLDSFRKREVTAAYFFLDSTVQQTFERVILEGGPGQGKSTVTQFICQVHRVRLLEREGDTKLVPDDLRNLPLRLPLKIDLRHIASWVEHINPYEGNIPEEYFHQNWSKSLEAFLLCHIYFHSKIKEFNSHDLLAVLRQSRVLIVFDGFDEIANIQVRGDVVDFINRGLNRLKENSKSIQVIITSRPAAFMDNLEFSPDIYPHFELGEISPKFTDSYVKKWVLASRLDHKESTRLCNLVEEKLKLPHLRDLAKSPMQLAIFISLLRTKGDSLPNKRTALYDSYIGLFFDRESEKNNLIRDNRDLVIDIHKYLAWLLHSEAEIDGHNGIIRIDRLKRKIKEYLSNEEHKTDLGDKLFDVVKERVCALASRIQGTFEFEVQPLREYFCAKYLYETAPYAPPGIEKSGTLPERFDVVSKNFYWQNVLRFFAGCFNRGELPLLVDKLGELHEHPTIKYIGYPKQVTTQLVSDYVFTQYPRCLKDAVNLILESINKRQIIYQIDENNNQTSESIILPTECGRSEVVTECFKQLCSFPPVWHSKQLIGIIINNPFKTLEIWKDYENILMGPEKTKWLDYAQRIGIVQNLDLRYILTLLRSDSIELRERVKILLASGSNEFLESDKEIKLKTLEFVLGLRVDVNPKLHPSHSMRLISMLVNPSNLLRILLGEAKSITFLSALYFRYNRSGTTKAKVLEYFSVKISDEIDELIDKLFRSTKDILSLPISEWQSNIEPWDVLVTNLEQIFGDHYCNKLISLFSSAIRSKQSRFDDYANLGDNSISICKRARCARLRSGNLKYWKSNLNDDQNLEFKLMTFFCWTTPKVLSELNALVTPLLEQLGEIEFQRVFFIVRHLSYITGFKQNHLDLASKIILDVRYSLRLRKLVFLRLPNTSKKEVIASGLDTDPFQLPDMWKFELELLIRDFFDSKETNFEILNRISVVKRSLGDFDDYENPHVDVFNEKSIFSEGLNREHYKKILETPQEYPFVLYKIAERYMKSEVIRDSVIIGKYADDRRWFQDS